MELFRYLVSFCVDASVFSCTEAVPLSMVVLGTASFFVVGLVLAATMLALSNAHGKLDHLLASVSVA